MMKRWPWILSFLILYGVHGVFYLTFTGRLAIPIFATFARSASIVTLVGLTLLVMAFIATRDEVMRKIALQAAGASAVATAFFSYGLVAFDVSAQLIASNLWAFAIFVFLLAYGALSWRARS